MFSENDSALHEAGHCVVAHALGGDIEWSTIDPSRAFGMPGATTVTFPPSMLDPGLAKRWIVTYLGGQAATDKEAGSPSFAWPQHDDLYLRHVGPHPAGSAPVEGGSDYQKARLRAQSLGGDWVLHVVAGRRLAERLVASRDCWTRIQSIARALIAERYLDEEHIRRLIS